MPFTLVFDGDLPSFGRNPLKTDTPFGRPRAASIDDAFARCDELEQERDALREALKHVLTSVDSEFGRGTAKANFPFELALLDEGEVLK